MQAQTGRPQALPLKKEKRKLSLAMKAEYEQMLRDFRSLCLAMRETERQLRGALGDKEQQSAAFLRGYNMGLEYAQVQALQKEIDQQIQAAPKETKLYA